MVANAVYQLFIVIGVTVVATLGAVLYFQRSLLKQATEDLLRSIEIWVELAFTLLAAVLGMAAIVQELRVRQ